MKNLIPVTGYEGSLVRDPVSNAIVNIDKSSFEAFREKRLAEKKKDEELMQIQEKLQRLEELVSQLLQRDIS